jgi:hypothetical protein
MYGEFVFVFTYVFHLKAPFMKYSTMCKVIIYLYYWAQILDTLVLKGMLSDMDIKRTFPAVLKKAPCNEMNLKVQGHVGGNSLKGDEQERNRSKEGERKVERERRKYIH